MAHESDVHYAVTGDGAHIAFQILGDGAHDVVLASANTIPIGSMWEDPEISSMLDALAEMARVVLLDRRGIGYSDPLAPGTIQTAEESMADIVTVLDAAGVEHGCIVKTDSAAPVALLATTVPQRVSGLVLFNAYARLARADDHPIGLAPHVLAAYLRRAEQYDMEPAADLLGRPRSADPAFRRWLLTSLRRSAPPGSMPALVRQDFETDVRHVLPLIQAPTLVMHTANNPYISAAHGRYLADHIPGARYRELPGDAHILAAADTAQVVEHVAELLIGRPPPRRIDRVFATVLFTDIVDSTQRAVQLGDARWRSVLDRHDAFVSRQLSRYGGRLVNTTGDGVVATFDGPARAVTCAVAIRDGLRRLGLDVRIGIHAGEVEMRGGDVSGIAVHVASRVQSHAAPAEILVSRTVVDLVAGSGLHFAGGTDVALKGLPGTWTVFSVTTA